MGYYEEAAKKKKRNAVFLLISMVLAVLAFTTAMIFAK